MWSDIQQTEIEKLKRRQEEGIDIRLAGDGRFDSRGIAFIKMIMMRFIKSAVHIFSNTGFGIVGFSASYCTYNLMDLASSKVIGIWVAHKNMVTSSSEMEPYAAKALLLSFAWIHGLIVHSVTTDRSKSMKSMLE